MTTPPSDQPTSRPDAPESPADGEHQRVQDERQAWEHGGVYERQDQMRARLAHVFQSPNTRHHERAFDARAFALAQGSRVLEIGCSSGAFTQRLLDAGAAHVTGIDLAESEVAAARAAHTAEELTFRVHDANDPLDGTFDLIVGRAVLHHLRWHDVLPRLYEHNLAPGGTMLFWEPMGSNTLLKLYHRYATSLHTDEERPFYRRDLRWIRSRFPQVELVPVNLLSLPAGVASSLLLRRLGPDNALMRAADRADRRLGRVAALGPSFRVGMLAITKP